MEAVCPVLEKEENDLVRLHASNKIIFRSAHFDINLSASYTDIASRNACLMLRLVIVSGGNFSQTVMFVQ